MSEMTIEEQRALCAEVMGWTFHKQHADGPWPRGETILFENVWVDKDGHVVVADFRYRPDADTPEGREQANELLEALRPTIHVTLEILDNRVAVILRDIEDPDWLMLGGGRKWPAALVAAVAGMQEKEK
ncbi:MAG: hypothetical protein ABIG61_12045 [Planctomycetota bacterium]